MVAIFIIFLLFEEYKAQNIDEVHKNAAAKMDMANSLIVLAF